MGDAHPRVERDAAGRVRYAWRAGAEPLAEDPLRALVAKGSLRADEAWRQLHDFETGQPIAPGWGSVAWNAFRRRWVAILGGPPGDIWFAEADTPVGPWVYARRVVSHDHYNFYNPTQHPFFDQEGGRRIYFEGTYTDSFSGAPVKTPRYDYNQIMYGLDLADPRQALPAPVYRLWSAEGKERYAMREGVESRKQWERIDDLAFFAVAADRKRPGLVPIAAPDGAARPLFYALPAEEAPRETLDGTWRCRAQEAAEDEITFELGLSVSGETVTGRLNGAETVAGTARGGRVELRLSADDVPVERGELDAPFADGQLLG